MKFNITNFGIIQAHLTYQLYGKVNFSRSTSPEVECIHKQKHTKIPKWEEADIKYTNQHIHTL